MKTTLNLPDDLMQTVKLRALSENRKLTEMITLLLRRGLTSPGLDQPSRQRVALPLVKCAHPAAPGSEITPDRAAEILLEDEAEAARVSLRQ